MGYRYETERSSLFTDEGQRKFLLIRDNVHRLLKQAGAVRMEKAVNGVGGDSWQNLACVDRLVELKEIREITDSERVAAQHRVFVSNRD